MLERSADTLRPELLKDIRSEIIKPIPDLQPQSACVREDDAQGNSCWPSGVSEAIPTLQA